MISPQLVMFGCLECSCPDAVKFIKKYNWSFHLGGHRDRLACDQKVNSQFAWR